MRATYESIPPPKARTIVLSGFMATGKTTIGERLASRLGVPFIDTDRTLEERSGKKTHEIWTNEGEVRFREREAVLVRELLAKADDAPAVIAFGGGTVTRRDVRWLALDRALLVTLTATPETIELRAGDATTRPNLRATGDPRARAAELLLARADAYAECHFSLPTDDASPDDLVDAIVSAARRTILAVPLGERSYTVDFVNDDPMRLTDVLARLAPSGVVIVTDSNVARARKKALDAALEPLPFRGTLVTLPPGEVHKTIASVGTIWDAALGTGIDRDAVLVGFGGGVVGDLTGFAASTLLRGVRYVHVPTTVLAMADSSVGGKTGFDHPTGKNLVGTFHQPSAVVVDVAHLASLPRRERAAGLAEVVKMALLGDAPLFEWLERSATALAAGDPAALGEAIERSVTAKARIVRQDERESGLRGLLNVGHTVGHALEAKAGFRALLHGEAVAKGAVVELGWGAALEKTPKELVSRTAALFEALELSASTSAEELAGLHTFLARDKKRAGDTIRLPVVTSLGAAELLPVPLARLVLLSEDLVGRRGKR